MDTIPATIATLAPPHLATDVTDSGPAFGHDRYANPPVPPVAARGARALSPFEFLPGIVAYGPVVLQWIALGLRHGSLSLPTAANPHITTGGLCGESKSAILDLVRGAARRLVAPYTVLVTGDAGPARAARAMDDAGLSYPVVVKPDIGCNGSGVRLVHDAAAMTDTLAAFPRGVALVVQRLVPWEGEAGLFYIRHPDEACGHISSLTLKYPPVVTGDGHTPLRELIMGDPRHGKLAHLYLARLGARLDEIPAPGARVRLVFAGNHCKGSIFENGAAHITPALTARIEAVARAMPDFHFGRIDVRFADLDSLRAGREFQIIEINGVGSEATHIWDPATRLRDVFLAQFRHYGAAFRIAAALRARGFKPSGVGRMWRDWRRQQRLMASYPLND